MATRSILLRFPGCPFHLDSLRPNAYLASSAAILKADGHQTKIADYGTTEIFDRLYPVTLREIALQVADENELRGLRAPAANFELKRRRPRGQLRTLFNHHESIMDDIARETTRDRELDFVCLYVSRPEEYRSAHYIAKRIRALAPRLHVIASGPFFWENPEAVMHALECFDNIHLSTLGGSLARWAAVAKDKQRWHEIHDLAYHDGVRLIITKSDKYPDVAGLPDPAYDTETYSALQSDQKIIQFDVPEIVQLRNNCGQESETWMYRRPVDNVVHDLARLTQTFRMPALHLSGSEPGSDHAQAVAQAILAKKLRLRYSRDAHVTSMSSASLAVLNTSGCAAIEYRVDTGSQRLLDRVYNHAFTVSDVEKAVRASRFSNLFTIMRFVYPHPQDDYHTEDETLRLIDRAKPNAAPVDFPWAPPRGDAATGNAMPHALTRRAQKKAWTLYRTMIDTIRSRNVVTDMTPQIALMAERAGFAGREEKFYRLFRYQIMTGDANGVSSTVHQINRGATHAYNAIEFKPFVPFQNVVGN